jgi:hypothetical protein
LGEIVDLIGEILLIVIGDATRDDVVGGPVLVLGQFREHAPKQRRPVEKGCRSEGNGPVGADVEPKARTLSIGLEGIPVAFFDAPLAYLDDPIIDGDAEGKLDQAIRGKACGQ